MRRTTWIFLAALLLTNMGGGADADQLRPLVNDLKSTDTEAALNAIKGLRASGDIGAVPPLLAALRDERIVVRQYAVEALQQLLQTLDGVYGAVRRWLQSLINQLQRDPSGGVVTANGQPLDLRAKKA
jgi:hypothetical protein